MERIYIYLSLFLSSFTHSIALLTKVLQHLQKLSIHILRVLLNFITRDYRACIGKSVHRNDEKHIFHRKISTQCE